MNADFRLGWAPLAHMIAEDEPAPKRAKPPALVRRVATEFKGPCIDARDMDCPAGWGSIEPLASAIYGAVKTSIGKVVGTQVSDPRNIVVNVHVDVDMAAFSRTIESMVAAGRIHSIGGAVACTTTTMTRPEAEAFVPYAFAMPEPMNFPGIELALSAPAEPEWIEWKGGECPIANGVRHEVMLRHGGTFEDDDAGSSEWGHEEDASKYDIVAYRVLP